MMKMSFKSMAAAAVLAVVSLPSLAQVTVPPQPSPGPIPTTGSGSGGLLVVAYDSVRGVSISQYLGLTMDQFLPTATSANGITSALNFGTLGGWSSVFGASSSSNIKYAVFAGDTLLNPGATVAGRRLMTTATTPNAAGSVSSNNSGLNNALTTVNEFTTRLLSPSCNNGLTNPCNALSSDEFQYAGRLGDNLNELIAGGIRLAFSNTAVVGNAMSFWMLTTTTAPQGAAAVSRYENGLGLGQWLLSSAGELSYSLPAVPLPAGVWLLLSGLAGAAAVGRRKIQAAA
jgi:hypothetical protein